MSKFWSPFVKDLVPYVPGEQPKLTKLVKLNTNENPYGPSPKALAAMQAELNDNLRLYPDPNSDLLKQAVAKYYGVDAGKVFLGNGSDEVLAHIFHGLFQHDLPLLFPDISYSFYPVYCGLYGIKSDPVPLDEQFQIRVADYAKPNGGIIFPNPNAPTGCVLALNAVEQILKASPDSVGVALFEGDGDFGAGNQRQVQAVGVAGVGAGQAQPEAFFAGFPSVAVEEEVHAVAALHVDMGIGVVRLGAGDAGRDGAGDLGFGSWDWAKADGF